MKTLLQISDLHKSYGAHTILSGATASFGERQKIGVIGRNGAGKSTLFRIILGDEEADSGRVIPSGDLRLGYVAQASPYEAHETTLEFLMRYTGQPDWQCGKMAGRFQLKDAQLASEIGNLSGGYQMRAKLTAMLLAEPNFLLLDEPTNYLDLSTQLLLERFLADEWKGGFMVISHDREFLKRTCAETLEVERGEVFLFPGTVEAYLEFKSQRQDEMLRRRKNLDARRKELESFVERFRAKASKASQAQSKLKQLGRLETVELANPLSNVRIRIPSPDVRKGFAVRTEDLSVGYPDKTVASAINLEVKRGSRAAVLGDNGQGKTTLLKTLAGRLPELSGNVRWSEGGIAFYAQHVYSAIDESQTVLKYLELEAPRDIGRQPILDMAGSFLFRGEDVEKPVRVLSGGERARLCLAGILLSRSHVLLLDEPTNHLDFETVEALGLALRDYSGTVLFVSHDRTFVNLVATEIIEVDNGSVTLFPGSYPDYVYRTARRIEEAESQDAARASANGARKKPNKKQKKGRTATEPDAGSSGGAAPGAADDKPIKSDHQLRKERRAELNRARTRFAKLESEMQATQAEKQEIIDFLADNAGTFDRERNERLGALEALAAEQEGEWLELQDTIEKLTAAATTG